MNEFSEDDVLVVQRASVDESGGDCEVAGGGGNARGSEGAAAGALLQGL